MTLPLAITNDRTCKSICSGPSNYSEGRFHLNPPKAK